MASRLADERRLPGIAFVDTTVFVYAVGRPHPLRDPARAMLRERFIRKAPMATSAEVLQELLHVYIPVGRLGALDAAFQLALDLTSVWPIEASDIRSARDLVVAHPGLGARDLVHLAVCRRYRAAELLSFDRALTAAFSGTGRS